MKSQRGDRVNQAPGTTTSLISCVTSGKWLALSEPLFLAGNVRALRHACRDAEGTARGDSPEPSPGEASKEPLRPLPAPPAHPHLRAILGHLCGPPGSPEDLACRNRSLHGGGITLPDTHPFPTPPSSKGDMTSADRCPSPGAVLSLAAE